KLQQDRIGNSHKANFSAAAQFPYKISFEGRITYSSNALSQGRTTGSVSTDFGIRKTFMGNKVLVRLMAIDPLAQKNYKEFIDGLTVAGNKYLQERDRIISTRNYSLTLSYRFTNTRKTEMDNTLKKIT